ncbi:hypothetical protein [Streptomyces gobiensis]|uniref:hypothetical protein n=1 Tax=Streptomyces gobiensis TaxID=2875706 RepID=UPI001E3E2066|nr:hypothetical protein [Streptomyces gobiensis]UGY91382.1 hypothetical protein test1122_06370 [Streptomyces gobiensis]
MSIPGEQPNPYAQSGSHPYTQPQPTMAYGAAMPPPAPPGPPAAPPSPPRKGLPGWLWGVSGAFLASAVWTAAMIATGGFGEKEPESDLAGYHFHSDMCRAFDRSALRGHYSEDTDREPTQYSSEQDALDSSYCSVRLKAPGARSYDTTYVSFQVAWHKRANPEGEFEARMREYEHRESKTADYEVEAVDGLGEEAFLITDRSKRSDKVRWAKLAVRDGWVETTLDWNDLSSATRTEQPTKDRLRDMLTSDTKATLEALKKEPEGSAGSADADDADDADSPDDSSTPENTAPPKRGEGDI